jgi:nifR3 family TIM-barrel protein
MNNGFWQKLKKPIMVLAPMADVTDAAFRRVIAKYGKPDVMWTEFVSADGLLYADEKGKQKLLKDLEFSEGERPIVAQFFTAKPEMMREAAKLAVKLGFDGIDINMGCPVKRVQKQGSCSALIKTPKIAREMIREAKAGAGDLPVSVKTRLGFNKDELETWLPELLAEEPAVITMHARTQKEMSKVPARWERIKRAVEIRNELKSETLIFGNGDLVDLPDAEKKVAESGADGAMLGRAIFGNPWLFDPNHKIPTVEEKLRVAIEHTKLFEALLGGYKNFALMKKHYKAYVNGFDGAKELRVKLMEVENAQQVEDIVNEFIVHELSLRGLAKQTKL